MHVTADVQQEFLRQCSTVPVQARHVEEETKQVPPVSFVASATEEAAFKTRFASSNDKTNKKPVPNDLTEKQRFAISGERRRQ